MQADGVRFFIGDGEEAADDGYQQGEEEQDFEAWGTTMGLSTADDERLRAAGAECEALQRICSAAGECVATLAAVDDGLLGDGWPSSAAGKVIEPPGLEDNDAAECESAEVNTTAMECVGTLGADFDGEFDKDLRDVVP